MAVRQVTGTELTFAEAVDQSIIPKPALQDWNSWQRWRKAEGGRPTREADGAVLDNKQEAELWKIAMEYFYGTEWLVDLSIAAAETTAGTQGTLLGPASGPAGPATGIGGAPPDGAPPLVATPRGRGTVSPGSGSRTGAAEHSPGSGAASPISSWHSSAPGSPGRLQTRLQAGYRPMKEPLEKYLVKLEKQAQVLARLDQPLGEGVLETLKAIAH